MQKLSLQQLSELNSNHTNLCQFFKQVTWLTRSPGDTLCQQWFKPCESEFFSVNGRLYVWDVNTILQLLSIHLLTPGICRLEAPTAVCCLRLAFRLDSLLGQSTAELRRILQKDFDTVRCGCCQRWRVTARNKDISCYLCSLSRKGPHGFTMWWWVLQVDAGGSTFHLKEHTCSAGLCGPMRVVNVRLVGNRGTADLELAVWKRLLVLENTQL